MAAVLGAAPLHAGAQQQLLVPEGTVFTVRSETELDSRDTQVGDRFMTTVTEAIQLNGFNAIPAGSRIEGTVEIVRPATSRQSGIVGVDFTRLVLPSGNVFGINGKLTSLDPTERRQIDAQGGTRVVFVGGRTGVGAAIGSIGAGAPNDPVTGLLGALGTVLSRGADVVVPVNTMLAVQLESALSLVASGTGTGTGGSTIYTSTQMVRAAQQALRARNYYRGPVDGRLANDTRRALFEFQIDNEIYATGNLDDDTAMELGISNAETPSSVTPAMAAEIRRNAQSLVAIWRDAIGVTPAGRLDPRRNYQTIELDLYFALSAFADNASLYDQMVRQSASAAGMTAVNQALMGSARRVDAAMQRLSVPSRTLNAWRNIQSSLSRIDYNYLR
jgi:stage V sporulation protein SpoVS